MQSRSARWKLDGVDWEKLGKSAFIALGGALAAWVGGDLIPAIQAGASPGDAWTETMVAGMAMSINVVRKFVSDNRTPSQKKADQKAALQAQRNAIDEQLAELEQMP